MVGFLIDQGQLLAGLLTQDLVFLILGIQIIQIDGERLGIDGIVFCRCHLLDGILAEIQLGAGALAVFIALDLTDLGARFDAHRAVQRNDILLCDDLIGRAGDRLFAVGVNVFDIDHALGGRHRHDDPVGIRPVARLGDLKFDVLRKAVALRRLQIVQGIPVERNFFRKEEAALGGGFKCLIGDLGRIIGVQHHRVAGGVFVIVQLELNAFFFDGFAGFFIDDRHKYSRLIMAVVVIDALAGVIAGLVVTAAATAASAVLRRTLVQLVGKMIADIISVVILFVGTAVIVFMIVLMLFLIHLRHVQQKQHQHQQNDQQQSRHNVGKRLPVIIVARLWFFDYFHHKILF